MMRLIDDAEYDRLVAERDELRALLKRVRGTMPPLCYAAPAEAQLIEDIERALRGGK